MAEPKTRPNDGDVEAFLASVDDEERRQYCRTVMELLERLTGDPPNLRRLEDVDLAVLEELAAAGLEDMDRRYPTGA